MRMAVDVAVGPDAAGDALAALPVLARGAHRSPASGACLMEYTALLAGEPFGDHPSCTHPALAQLARQVNDRVGDTARPPLVTRAPALAAIGPECPGVVGAVASAVVMALYQYAPDSLLLHRRMQVAATLRDQEGHLAWTRRRDLLRLGHLTSACLDGVERRISSTDQRDRVLTRVLDRALATTRSARGPSRQEPSALEAGGGAVLDTRQVPGGPYPWG